MRKSKFSFGFSLAVVLLLLVLSCNRYYKAVKTENPAAPAKTVDSLTNENRYFILRSGTEAFQMSKLLISDDNKTLQCTLDSLPQVHRLHVTHGRSRNLRYITGRNDDVVLNEVHLYIPFDTISPGPYSFSLDKIQKIEVIEKDKKRTTNSYVLGGLGYTVGVFSLVGVIVAATKSSCPFVSAYTDNEFQLQGEIYGGAIYPQLERDDYMPLRMQTLEDGTLQLKISNELKEKQYTDMADLIVVNHDNKSTIVADGKGNLYEIKDPAAPLTASTTNRQNVLPELQAEHDDKLLSFDDTLQAGAVTDMVASFRKPVNAKTGKLVISVKNTYWLDYLYGEMGKSFGSYYTSYVKKQLNTPASTLLQWVNEQHIPLKVSVRTPGGWKEAGEVTTIGPLATRKIVLPIDLSDVSENVLDIKFSAGFMFWEIDYVAMDFTGGAALRPDVKHPLSAIDENGNDVITYLQKKDGIYLEQPHPGMSVTLKYESDKPGEGRSNSYFLHTRGYYTYIRNYTGKPKIAFLKQFKKPGAFPAYSLSQYKKIINNPTASLVQK